MTRTIGSLGYIGRPEFAFDCPVDEDQITSMLAARDDRIVMAHWDDLDVETLAARAWDVRRGEWVTQDFSRCAALLILKSAGQRGMTQPEEKQHQNGSEPRIPNPPGAPHGPAPKAAGGKAKRRDQSPHRR
jgi:hypothetical protein